MPEHISRKKRAEQQPGGGFDWDLANPQMAHNQEENEHELIAQNYQNLLNFAEEMEERRRLEFIELYRH
jgi:hypothetical protein